MSNTTPFRKDPAATADYGCDWRQDLQSGETIAQSSWSGLGDGAGALTIPADPDTGDSREGISGDGGVAIIWLSGGVAGQWYYLVNRIVTSRGRTDERTLVLRVTDR